MSELERNVDRILAGHDAQVAAEDARVQAIEGAKPAAFAAFAAVCADAAVVLAKRGLAPETRKQAVVGHRKEKRLWGRKTIDIPVTEPISGWILHRGWKTVDRGGASHYNDPRWLA